MNIRLSKNRIRFRITQSELGELKEKSLIHEETALPNGERIRYEVVVKETPLHSSLLSNNYAITLTVSPNALQKLANTLPSREGLEGKASDLEYSLEVDVRR